MRASWPMKMIGFLFPSGREYIANPDLVERIRHGAVLNEQRPSGGYGSSPVGYTDYPTLANQSSMSAFALPEVVAV